MKTREQLIEEIRELLQQLNEKQLDFVYRLIQNYLKE